MPDIETGSERFADFDPADWYWIVAGDESRPWSGARAGSVGADDAAYLAWLKEGRRPTRIASAFELDLVLRQHGLSLGRSFTAEEALTALTAIDAGRVKRALCRDKIGEILPGDADKLLSLAAEPQSISGDAVRRAPEIDGIELPKTAEEDLAELKQRFAAREAELVEKGVIAAS